MDRTLLRRVSREVVVVAAIVVFSRRNPRDGFGGSEAKFTTNVFMLVGSWNSVRKISQK